MGNLAALDDPLNTIYITFGDPPPPNPLNSMCQMVEWRCWKWLI
jgi:hypothetical protein